MAKDKKAGVPYVAKALIGAVLMVGGFWFSRNVELGFQKSLAEQGLPLDLGMSVSVIGVFLILFPVMKSFYFDALAEAIHARSSELEQTFAEAENLRSEMTQMKSDYEKRLAETEQQAREQIQAQIREAQALRDQLRQEAVQQADEFKKRALDEIDAEKQKILIDLRLHVVNLTLQATEKLVGESMDTAKNRRLVEEFIEKVEVPN